MFDSEGLDRQVRHSLVGCREYQGVGISGPAGGGPDPEGCAPCGTAGGAMGGFGWVSFFGDADWPGWVAVEEVELE